MRRDPAKAIAVLDAMLEFFDGGKRWMRGQLQDGQGNRCLVGALQYARSIAAFAVMAQPSFYIVSSRHISGNVSRMRRRAVSFC